MSCEKYREALVELAVTRGALEAGLAEHIERCSQCRAKWQHEHALFAAIDDALRGRMNECPQESFLPRIRDRIVHEAKPEAGWNPIWAWAGAALVLLLLAVAHPWTVLQQHPVERSLNSLPVHLPHKSVLQNSKAVRLVRGSTDISERREHVRWHSAERSMAKPSLPSEPEVLVPPDEARAFAQFVARLAIRDKMAEAVVSPAKDATAGNAELPEIRSVDIAELQLNPQKWRGWDGVSDAE